MTIQLCINPKARYVLVWKAGRRVGAHFWVGRWSWERLMRSINSPAYCQVAVVGDEHWMVKNEQAETQTVATKAQAKIGE